ncbi:MAG: OmpA family protein, partial [Campylobacterales bacterium]|nr:OmpA family protein [Campylobacterales bacterium]
EALPLSPVSVLFYFEEGTASLTPESQAQTASLVELIQSREPCVVDIIGHTDTQGNAEGNDRLGLERAQMVKSFLEERQIQMKEVSVTSHGEGDLLVPTGDGVDEPRNRRVEVIVR